MDIRTFNVCLLLGWLFILAGGIVIHPGWGLAVGGAVLLVLTLICAYIGGIKPVDRTDGTAG